MGAFLGAECGCSLGRRVVDNDRSEGAILGTRSSSVVADAGTYRIGVVAATEATPTMAASSNRGRYAMAAPSN